MSRARLGLLLRGLCSVGLIAWLLSRVHWGELGGILRGAHPAPLVCAGLLTLTGLFLMVARARLLLRHWGIALPYRTVLSLTWLGQFCNTFLPGSTGGDVVKFYRVCRLAPNSKTAGFAALVADRLVALAALVLLAGTALVVGDRGVFRQLAGGVTMPGMGHLWVGGMVLAFLAVILLASAAAWLWRGGHLERARAWWRADPRTDRHRPARRPFSGGGAGCSRWWCICRASPPIICSRGPCKSPRRSVNSWWSGRW